MNDIESGTESQLLPMTEREIFELAGEAIVLKRIAREKKIRAGKKILGKCGLRAGALSGLMFAFQAALLQFPDSVSSSVEDYMEHNDIPKALIRGVDTRNVRVYDENTLSAALHAAAFRGWPCLRDFCRFDDTVQSYWNAMKHVLRDEAAHLPGSDSSMIVMGDPRQSALAVIQGATGLPLADIEVTDHEAKIFFYGTFMHEVSHEKNVRYRTGDLSEARYRDFLSPVASTASGEIMADLGEIESLKKIGVDISKSLIYRCAMAALYQRDVEHANAVFLDALVAGLPAEDLPPLEGLEGKVGLLRDQIKHSYEGLLSGFDEEDSLYESYKI